jgi:hypothetical protein
VVAERLFLTPRSYLRRHARKPRRRVHAARREQAYLPVLHPLHAALRRAEQRSLVVMKVNLIQGYVRAHSSEGVGVGRDDHDVPARQTSALARPSAQVDDAGNRLLNGLAEATKVSHVLASNLQVLTGENLIQRGLRPQESLAEALECLGKADPHPHRLVAQQELLALPRHRV